MNTDKLHSNYVPPLSIRTAGGENIFAPPSSSGHYIPQPEPAFTRTG